MKTKTTILYFCLFFLVLLSCNTHAGPSIRDIEQKMISSVFAVETYFNHPDYMQSGTAFVIKSIDNNNGTHTYHFLTNAHVVDEEYKQEISWQLKSYNNALSLNAKLIGVDHEVDIAVLKATVKNSDIKEALNINKLTPFTWGNIKTVFVQDKVISIGNTKGRGIVTHTGHVNSVHKGKSNYNFAVLQTDAATNKGNSGSPILNEKGELIGVHFYGDRNTGVLVGYEIPVDRAKKSYENILAHQQNKAALYGYWGLHVVPMDITLQNYFFKDKNLHGVQISNVYKNSPALKAGIKPGDILLTPHKIYNYEDLYLITSEILDSTPNNPVTLNIFRNNKVIQLTLQPTQLDAGQAQSFHTDKSFTVTNLKQEFIDRHLAHVKGVFADFDNKNLFSMFGNFRKQSIIQKVNNVPTPNVETFKKEWQKASKDNNSIIVITVYYTSYYYYTTDGGVGNVQDVVIRK